MKNVKKLNLNDLKVESFVTSTDRKHFQTIKGGTFSEPFVMSLVISTAAVVALTSVIAATNDEKNVEKQNKKNAKNK